MAGCSNLIHHEIRYEMVYFRFKCITDMLRILDEGSFQEELRTEQGLVEAFVFEVLVDKQPLLGFETAAAKFHKVTVLDACDERHFVEKLVVSLLRFGGQLLDRHFHSIWKHPLINVISIKN